LAVAGHPYLLLEAKQDERLITVTVNRIKAINLFFIMAICFVINGLILPDILQI
jgi:hypothetical protein